MQAFHLGDTVSGAARPMPASLFGHQPTAVNDGGGIYVDLYELDYRVLDAASTERITWTAVDLVADAVPEVAQGLYAPSFALNSAWTSYGTWTIQWRYRLEAGGTQLTAETYFRVVTLGQPIVRGYAQVQDLVDEGVPTSMFTAARMAMALEQASRQFEDWTGRFFEPRVLVLNLDGRGGPIHQCGAPIIGIAGITFTFTTFSPADLPISTGSLRVYNRHIRENLFQPDDRDDPRVEFLRVAEWRNPHRFIGEEDLLDSYIWFPPSQQNVALGGVFGYTDWDGTPFGKTPELVKEAVLRLALRRVRPLWQLTGGGGTSIGVSGPITSERTLDQSVTYANSASVTTGAYLGQYTGDTAIDQIVETYRRPPIFGSA